MDRRRFLIIAGGITTVAGCTGGDSQNEGKEDGEGADGGGETNDTDESQDNGNDTADEDGEETREAEWSGDDTLLSVSNPTELGDLPFDANTVAEFEGEGSTVTDEFTLDSGLTMLVFESENVEGKGLGADVEQTDGDDGYVLAINEIIFYEEQDEIDTVSGASLFEAAGGTYLLDVDTDGAWTIHVAQPGHRVRRFAPCPCLHQTKTLRLSAQLG